LESECDFVVDINMIGVYKSQIKYYEIMLNQSMASGDIQWYKSQIRYLEDKIKELGD
jgi:tRNA G18 (ribose-2'-O)-methylase SpoU